MTSCSSLLRVLSSGAFLLLWAMVPLGAQETRGTFAGTVADTSGATVSAAAVVVTNTDTNTVTQITTNSTGYYEAPLLAAGNYQIVVTASGFKKVVRSGLSLGLGQQQEINITLEIGNTSESVLVSGESPILDTSTTSSGKVLTTKELMDLPVLANNIIIQARMVQGVQTSGTTQYLTHGQIGGSSTSYFAAGNVGGNEWTLDGQPQLASGRNTSFTPHTDMIAEFKVETISFDSSFGHSTGLNINMSSKSGTNQLHGTSTWEFWDERFAAAPYFIRQQYYTKLANARAAGNTSLVNQILGSPIYPKGHSNNFAGTIGGPVVIPKLYNGKNKLFWFFAYDGARDNIPARPNDVNNTVPTAIERTGDFSDLLPLGPQYVIYDPLTVQPNPASAGHYIRTPFPGNVIPPSRIVNPMYSFYNSRIPLPNNSPTSLTQAPLTNYLAGCQPDNNHYNAFQNKVDYNPNQKNRFFFRWNWSHYIEFYGDLTCSGLLTTDDTRNNVSGVVDWTYTPTPTTVIDVAIAANQWFQRNVNSGITKYKPSDVGLPSYIDQFCLAHNDCSMPVVTLAGYFFYNGTSFGRALSPYPKVRSEALKANISHVRGTHSLRAGIDFRGQIRNDAGANGFSAGNFTFDNTFTQATDNGAIPAASIGHSWAAFQLGIPTTSSIDNNTSLSQNNPYFGWYGMDTWRLRHDITLTLGLRMEYETGPTERYNRAIGGFDPTIQLPIAADAKAAYAANPIPQLPVSSFNVQGGDYYLGADGRTRQLWQNQLMFLPRVAAAWQASSKTVLRAGYGIYYDTLNSLVESAPQNGFSCTQTNTSSDNSGVSFNLGNPANGIAPVSNPFPSMIGGNAPCQPYGSSLGPNYQTGRGFNFIPYGREHPRGQRWRGSVQRQIGNDMVVEATYWGQWAANLPVTQRLDALPAQYWATGLVRNNAVANALTANVTNPFNIANFSDLQAANPALYQYMSGQSFFKSKTIQVNQLLRPYPQVNGLNELNAPVGRDRIKALQLDFSKRFSQGLNLNASWSWLSAYDKTIFSNEFDPAPSWYPEYPAQSSRPHRVTVNGFYQLPIGKGHTYLKTGIPGAILGGWELAATWEFQSGDLLSFPNIYYYGDLNHLSSDLNSGNRSLAQWFNTNAPFERVAGNQPAAYSVRVFPQYIAGVRGDKLLQTNANIHRDIVFRERITMQLRMDMFNVFNRTQFADPDTNPNNTTFGRVTSQTGSQNRFIQLQGRIQF